MESRGRVFVPSRLCAFGCALLAVACMLRGVSRRSCAVIVWPLPRWPVLAPAVCWLASVAVSCPGGCAPVLCRCWPRLSGCALPWAMAGVYVRPPVDYAGHATHAPGAAGRLPDGLFSPPSRVGVAGRSWPAPVGRRFFRPPGLPAGRPPVLFWCAPLVCRSAGAVPPPRSAPRKTLRKTLRKFPAFFPARGFTRTVKVLLPGILTPPYSPPTAGKSSLEIPGASLPQMFPILPISPKNAQKSWAKIIPQSPLKGDVGNGFRGVDGRKIIG